MQIGNSKQCEQYMSPFRKQNDLAISNLIHSINYVKCTMRMDRHIVNYVIGGHVACDLVVWRKFCILDIYEHRKLSNCIWFCESIPGAVQMVIIDSQNLGRLSFHKLERFYYSIIHKMIVVTGLSASLFSEKPMKTRTLSRSFSNLDTCTIPAELGTSK